MEKEGREGNKQFWRSHLRAGEGGGKLAASEDGDILRKISFKSATLEK